jgi:hypothetical protein
MVRNVASAGQDRGLLNNLVTLEILETLDNSVV